MAAAGSDPRIAALGRFAAAITLFNVLGHTIFGFEQSVAQPLIALATAYGCDLLLEAVDAWREGRRPRWVGGARQLLHFLLPAHISALAVAMLLYANDRLAPIAFATAAAITSKYLFRVPVGGRLRHFLNPSNLGITATLLLFPWVGIAPPYMFTENLYGVWDWVLPAVIVVSGSILNARFTGRVPLIASWLGVFALQAVIRAVAFDTPLAAGLVPMTGVAFVLFTFYMVSDPGTTPRGTGGQLLFGASVALAYGALLVFHVVFGLFFALTAVCVVRGVALAVRAPAAERRLELAGTPSSSGAVGRVRA